MNRYPPPNVNPFNILAEGISRLKILDGKLFSVSAEARRSLHTSEQDAAVLTEAQRFFARSFSTLPDRNALIRSGLPPEYRKAITTWTHYDDFCHLLNVLKLYEARFAAQHIDWKEAWPGILVQHFPIFRTSGPQEFEALNDNAPQTGIAVLPPFLGIDRGKKFSWDRQPGVHTEFSNFSYLELDTLQYGGEPYLARHAFLSSIDLPQVDGPQFSKTGRMLRIAFCPLGCRNLLRWETYREDGQNRFRICGVRDEDVLKRRIRAAMQEAARNQAQIVIFPEMLGTADIVSADFFFALADELRKLGLPMPAMTLLPSWWHDDRNELYVRGGDGRLLCVQEKQFPYYHREHGELWAEDLRHTRRVIHVVHVPGLGRFGFPICRDFLIDGYVRLMLEKLHVNFLLCPSFSSHKSQFFDTGLSPISYGCYSCWCNACAAGFRDGKPAAFLGYASGPMEPGQPSSQLLSPNCKGQCTDPDRPCVFLTDIDVAAAADDSVRRTILLPPKHCGF